jgi:glucose-6-phosphate-specific signal transduction histidine kinase
MYNRKIKIPSAHLDDELEKIIIEIRGLKLPKSFSQYIIYILAELFSNIKEHSFGKMVRLEIVITGKHFTMNLSDNGIGLRQSYTNKNIISKDDQSAIALALSGLSTKDFRERGFGLYSTRKLTLALGGKFIISSGKASAVIGRSGIQFRNLKRYIKGVMVKIESGVKPLDFYKHLE